MGGRLITACAAIVALAVITVPAGAAHAQEAGEIIPAWVKQVFVYYANDQISEGELIAALTYLIDSNIIQINQAPNAPPAPAAEPEHDAYGMDAYTSTGQLKEAVEEAAEATKEANLARDLITSLKREASGMEEGVEMMEAAAELAEAMPDADLSKLKQNQDLNPEFIEETRYEIANLKQALPFKFMLVNGAAGDAERSAEKMNEWAQHSSGAAAAEYKKAAADYSTAENLVDEFARAFERISDAYYRICGQPAERC